MFISNIERQGTGYFEFQFCKSKNPIKKTIFGKKYIKGYKYWEDDSLYIGPEDFDAFFKMCTNIIDFNNNFRGTFSYFGDNYYDINFAKDTLGKLKKLNNKELNKLTTFLEEVVEKYNGFYILGI